MVYMCLVDQDIAYFQDIQNYFHLSILFFFVFLIIDIT